MPSKLTILRILSKREEALDAQYFVDEVAAFFGFKIFWDGNIKVWATSEREFLIHQKNR